jgi:NDP-sugar pyrophosphorylase family protein
MLNIVIPMAGRGSRFVKAGYEIPKPFIDMEGVPMIQRVVENLVPLEPHRFIFLARREHEELIKTHMSFARDIIYVDEVTEGAACTVLLARELINNSDSLVIANSDQLVRWNSTDAVRDACLWGDQFLYWKESNNIQDMLNDARGRALSASIATFHAPHPKWSYVKTKEDGLVFEVAEKKVISNNATVGIYYYRHGRHFVKYAEQMIEKNIRVNNEFYVCPVFNEMIESCLTIGTYPVEAMVGLGTPEDLELYKSQKWCL